MGRDPATIGRSAGITVHPLDAAGEPGKVTGTAEEVADDLLRAFREAGYTRIEITPSPMTRATYDALASVQELIRADQA